ncbi:MAG: hypothetical protein ACK506_18965 [Pirellula sp.]
MSTKNNDRAIETMWAIMTTIANELNRKVDKNALSTEIGEVADIVGELQLAFEESYMQTETFAQNPTLDIRPNLKIEIRRFFSFISESNEEAGNPIEYAANTAKALRNYLASGPADGPFSNQVDKQLNKVSVMVDKLCKAAKGYRASDSVSPEVYAEIRASVESEVQKAFESRLSRSMDRAQRVASQAMTKLRNA